MFRDDDNPSVTIVDATGENGCSSAIPQVCRLTGKTPFTLKVSEQYGEFRDFDLHAFRITGDTGCPDQPLAAFGATNNRLRGDGDPRAALCASFKSASGRLLVDARQSDSAPWTLFSSKGEEVCRSSLSGPTACQLRAGERGVFVMTGFSEEFRPPRYDVAAFDLASTAGCGAAVPSSWFAPPVNVTSDGDAQQDCHEVSGIHDSDRVALAFAARSPSADGGGILVDADGTVACTQDPWELGCTVRGQAPFRVVSYRNFDTVGSGRSYDLTARLVGPDSDCPHLDASPFGRRGDTANIGVGCRQFDVRAGRPFLARSFVGERDFAVEQDMYGSDFKRVCTEGTEDTESCMTVADEHVTLVTNLLGSQARTSLYDYGSTEGCTSPELGLGGHLTTTFTGASYCETIDVPSGTSVLTVQVDKPNVASPDASYVDRNGFPVCARQELLRGCTLSGPGPYRLLQRARSESISASTTLRMDDPGACTTFPRGVNNGVTLSFDDKAVARCLHVESDSRQPREVVYERASAGQPYFMGITAHGETCLMNALRAWGAHLGCVPDDTNGSYDVIVRSPGPSTVHLERAGYTGTVVNLRRPFLTGNVSPGSLVRADPGDWSSDPYNAFIYQWYLDGKAISGAHYASYRIPKSSTAKYLSVTVTNYPRRGITFSSKGSLWSPLRR